MIRFFVTLLLCIGMISPLACGGGDDQNNNNTEQGTTKDAAPADKEGACEFSSNCACNEVCKAGTCEAIQCSSSDDCRCSWKCVKGTCYDPAKAPCTADGDCTADAKLWKCNVDSGECIDGGCRKDEDCTDDKLPICNTQTNKCEKKKCKDNLDCTDSTKPICDTESGDCKEDTGADLGADCSSNACKLQYRCYEEDGKKLCRKPCSPSGASSQCDGTDVCIRVTGVAQADGLCLPPGEGEVLGASCAGGKKCQRPLTCAFDGTDEKCRKNCQADGDCSRIESCQQYGEIADGLKLCLPKPSPCGPGRSCPGEADGFHICSNGQCKLLLCPKQRSCGATEKCLPTGKCAPRECPTDKCDELYECKNGKCVETNEGRNCGQGASIPADQCGSGLICARVGYVYSCVRPCGGASGSQCPSDMTCQTNRDNKQICMQLCPAPKSCKYSGYACVNLKKAPAGNYCVPAGQPTGADEFEACTQSNPCLPDLNCFRGTGSAPTGYCVRSCTTDAECSGTSITSICHTYSTIRGCFAKCTSSSSTTCPLRSLLNNRNYCTYARSSTYYCRPY
ncbi:MAG: hypothetical protein EP343_29790 [Deltaproteobacteria bacterium]|nr:MAG: hypothetical protein EP343_29790 [Deltaproteobacteria bacterium]